MNRIKTTLELANKRRKEAEEQLNQLLDNPGAYTSGGDEVLRNENMDLKRKIKGKEME